MKTWLAKADPEHYSITDLEKEKTAIWKKVRHPKAMQFMAEMKTGDKLLVYHSGKEKQIVGLAKILDNNPDPTHPRGRLIKVEFVKKFSEPFVTLAQIKASGKFNDFRLVREPRLSVMDVPDKFLTHFKIQI